MNGVSAALVVLAIIIAIVAGIISATKKEEDEAILETARSVDDLEQKLDNTPPTETQAGPQGELSSSHYETDPGRDFYILCPPWG